MSLYAQDDRLGLGQASQQMAVKIPVAVASAMEASSLPTNLPYIMGSYFGGRYQYNTYQVSQLGNELQPRIGDLMMQMGYANIIQMTGFGGVQGQAAAGEMTTQRVNPQYVVVPTISFEGIGSKGQSVSLGAVGSVIGPVNNRVARTAVNEVSRSQINVGGTKVKATFSLRFYDSSGTQIMVEEACPETFTVEESQALRVGLTYGSNKQDINTLKPMAVRLTNAMTARLIGRGVCN